MLVHFSLLFILLFLNLLPEKRFNRKKFILPSSFLLILVYWAIRYDYGLDYWNYYNGFIAGLDEKKRGFGERWFFIFIHQFKYYYQVIIAESVIIVVSLYRMVWRYMPPKIYWLFFFLLFCISGLHFNLISAQRSTLAACVLYWAFDLFYITKKRWLPFIALVFVAAMFHTSALVFLTLPLVHLGFDRFHGGVVFLIIILADIMSLFYVRQLFDWAIAQSNLIEGYDYYSEIMQNRNFFGFLGKSVILFPTYYLCVWYDKLKSDKTNRSILILAFFGIFINMIGLNFQGRFTVYLYPYVIIAISLVCIQLPRNKKIIMLVPYLLSVVYFIVLFYQSLLANITGRWSVANPFYYHTLFDAPIFPF